MKNKKLLALGLATVMAASAMVVPAVAANNGKTTTVRIAGTTNAATVKVTISGSKKVILNPYKMTYKVSKTESAEDAVIPTNNSIINKSGVPLKVTFKATPTVSGELELSPTQLTTSDTGKVAYLVFGIQDGSVSGKTVTPNETNWKTATKSKKTVLVKSGNEGTKDADDSVYFMPIGDKDNPSGAAFAIYGDIVDNPKKTDSSGTTDLYWTSKDKVSTSIEFTFLPQSADTKASDVYGSSNTDKPTSNTDKPTSDTDKPTSDTDKS